jgi:hypothetical protein
MWNYDGGDMVSLTVAKYGLQIMVTEEVINLNLWDVFGMFLKYAGLALGRLQETEAIKHLNAFGITLFDNASPTTSQLGSCSGRGIDGIQNGSMTANDIFDMYAWLVMRGFNPDTLLIHPLAWRMFMADSETREVVLKGATLASRKMPQGNASPGWGSSADNGLGVRTQATGTETPATAGKGWPNSLGKIGANPWVNTLNPLSATFNIPPNYLPTPLTVLVSPHIPYTAPTTVGGAGKADCVMLDSQMAGILGTNGQGMTTEEFNKPETDIRAMKVKQYWGFGILEQGRSVGKAHDVVISRNYQFENVNNIVLTPINPTRTF